MTNHTHEKEVEFEFKGYNVVLKILAFKPVDGYLVNSCVQDWLRENSHRKMTGDILATFETHYGA